MTITAASTSRPPSSCSGASDSPNAAAASPTVTTGSSVERIDAADGPTRARPAKKVRIAPTVLTSAIAPSQPQPAAANARSGPPRTALTTANVPAAPVHTSAESGRNGTPASTRSPLRMQAV